MRRRVVVASAAVALAALAALLAGVLAGSSAPARPAVPVAAQDSLVGGFSPGGDTPGVVAALQDRARQSPNDAHALALLGLAYEQRARETGDPAFYAKAGGVLARAVSLAPRDVVVVTALGSLQLSRHRFREALALGERARSLAPRTAGVYGVVGDASLELGRYRQAFRAFDTMAGLKPNVASYARVSYARELLGDSEGAAQAMRLAVDAARGAREPLAWTLVQLGKLAWLQGDLAAADRAYRQALDALPGYAYGLDALAQVRAAQGRLPAAIALERRAADAIPLPQYVGALGDLYAASGRPVLARRQYALIGAIQRLLVANGVRSDLEVALFDVDHGIGLRHALALARRGRAERPSVLGDDVLAWALARNGRCGQALAYSRRALRLGSLDPVFLFHRGMIERCLGHTASGRSWLARALARNPHFSLLWAPVARKALAS